MSRGINKVILMGNVGADPQINQAESGMNVTKIAIATSESWKDKESGAVKEKTEWHQVVFFNKLADLVMKLVRKGSRIYVEGRLHTRQWQDKNGNNRQNTEVNASQVFILDNKNTQPILERNDNEINK